MYEHLHILGASGSGTSTMGAAVAQRIGYTHLDTDHYYWEQTDPPFRQPRDRSARQQLLAAALDASPRWVLTGSLCGWGGALHESWLATLPCRVVRLEGDRPLAELVAEVLTLAARGRRELQ